MNILYMVQQKPKRRHTPAATVAITMSRLAEKNSSFFYGSIHHLIQKILRKRNPRVRERLSNLLKWIPRLSLNFFIIQLHFLWR